MKNSTLECGVKVVGEAAVLDLTSELQTHLDGMFDDDLEQAVITMKRLIDASTAQFLVMIGELDRRQNRPGFHRDSGDSDRAGRSHTASAVYSHREERSWMKSTARSPS